MHSKLNRKRTDLVYFSVFLFPALLFFCVFLLYPVGRTLILSLYRWDGGVTYRFMGISNFVELMKDSDLLIALRNTGFFVLCGLLFIVPASFVYALFFRKDHRGDKVFSTLFFVPNILSEVAIAIIFYIIFTPNIGVWNTASARLSMPALRQIWLADANFSVLPCLLAFCWAYAASNMLIFNARLKNIDGEIYEAAEIEGVGVVRRVFAIDIPLCLGTIKSIVLITIASSMQQFAIPHALTGGGPYNRSNTIGLLIYKEGFINQHMGYASAIASLLFIITIGLIGLTHLAIKED